VLLRGPETPHLLTMAGLPVDASGDADVLVPEATR
jgi:hypothetical protein